MDKTFTLGSRRFSPWMAALLGVVAIKAILSLSAKSVPFAFSYSGLSYLLLLVLATGFSVRNAIQSTVRGRPFWMLLAAGCGLWAAHQSIVAYYELVLHIATPDDSIADDLLFLHIVPLLAAVATLPNRRHPDGKSHRWILNCLLLFGVWTFLYGFLVAPYKYFQLSSSGYGVRYDILYLVENAVLVLALLVAMLRAQSPWRMIYGHLLGASALYALSSTVANLAIDTGGYVNGRLYGFGLTASVCWLVWVPLSGRSVTDAETVPTQWADAQDAQFSKWAMLVVVMISIPMVWELFHRQENANVRDLRLFVTTAAIVLIAGWAYLKEHLDKREFEAERKRAELALRTSEERFRLAAQASRMYASEWIAATDAVRRAGDIPTVLGVEEKYLGETLEDYLSSVHTDDRALVSSSFRERTPESPSSQITYRLLRPDGSFVWLERTDQGFFDAQGKLVRTVGMAVDITERKRAESALRESEERFILATRAGRMYAFDWDTASDTLTRSGDVAAVVGVPAEDLGLTFKDLLLHIHPEDRDRALASFTERYPESPYGQFQFRVTLPDRSILWVERIDRAFFDAQGKLLRIVGMITNITERKQAEDALRESEEKFRSVFRDAGIGMVIVAPDGHFLAANPAFCECLGYTEEELLAKTVESITYPDDWPALFGKLNESLHDGRGFRRYEKRCVHKSGRILYTENSASLIRNKEGVPLFFVGEVIDITARKESEEALASFNRRLIEAQEEERIRIARELHDDISQRVTLLAIRLGQLKATQNGLSDSVRNQIANAQEQVTDLAISLHYLSHGLHSSTLELVGLSAAVQSWCDEFAEKRGVEVLYEVGEIPRCLPSKISLHLYRVLQEALNNAANHSGATSFHVRLWGTPAELHLSVTDEGKGFDVNNAMIGRGLGLKSMRERVGLMNGHLAIETQPNLGTTIHVRVPASLQQDHGNVSESEL